MTADSIKELIDRHPCIPFRMRLSNGDSVEVVNPDSVALMRAKVFVTDPRSEHWTFVSYPHIASIEPMGGKNGTSGHAKRRKPGA